MFLSFIGILINALQGFLDFNIYNANHIAFAFISTILYMFTQTLIMFYFIGSGKKIKETIINYKLDKSTYQEVIDIKMKLFPPLTLNMLFVGTAFVLGGGVHTGAINKYWHTGLFFISIIHYLKVIIIQHQSFIKNSHILSLLGKALEKK
tara:strand:- start:141 stop:590 length:450 start_codon:yes stop_codon:yes gene_type:complete